MGRNNKESRGKDVNWGYNQKKKKPFKFEFLNEHDCRMLEVANGLEIKDISMAIKINGKVDIELNDTLTIKGVNKLVIALTPEHDNPQQGRYKGSLEDYTGSVKVGLK